MNEKHHKRKKLVLRKTTVRPLSPHDLTHIVGGGETDTCATTGCSPEPEGVNPTAESDCLCP